MDKTLKERMEGVADHLRTEAQNYPSELGEGYLVAAQMITEAIEAQRREDVAQSRPLDRCPLCRAVMGEPRLLCEGCYSDVPGIIEESDDMDADIAAITQGVPSALKYLHANGYAVTPAGLDPITAARAVRVDIESKNFASKR